MTLTQDQLRNLVAQFGGYDDEASTQHALYIFAYFKMHSTGFLDSLATAIKILEVLTDISPAHHALVCENLRLLLRDLEKEQN